MHLGYCFRKATHILRRFSPDSRDALDALCRQVQDAERKLNAAAVLRLKGCLEDCRGLCCRNLDLQAVFGVPDFVYILAMEPSLESRIAECLRHEIPFFTSNCFFLESGVGPCLFPADVRPGVCITSFCRGDESLRSEIRRVKIGFWKLGLFLNISKFPSISRLLARDG